MPSLSDQHQFGWITPDRLVLVSRSVIRPIYYNALLYVISPIYYNAYELKLVTHTFINSIKTHDCQFTD